MTDPLASLRDRFRVRAAIDRAQLERLADGDRTSPDLRRLVHNLAGISGTFGFRAVSLAAVEVDDQMASGAAADTASLERLKESLDEVLRTA